jgi:predicted permease
MTSYNGMRQALRRLLRARAFALPALLTLALGIGGTAAVFTVVNGVLLRPLPYRDAGELVDLSHTLVVSGLMRVDQSDATFLLYARETRALADVAIYRPAAANFRPLAAGPGAGGAPAERVSSAAVSPSLFRVLDVAPLRGRGLTEDDAAVGAAPVAVVGRGLWQRVLGSDPGVIGRQIAVDGVVREIVGIMPAPFGFPGPETALWIPLQLDPARTNSAAFEYRGIARLKSGVSLEAAAADLQRLLPRVPEVFPGRLTAGAIEATRMQAVVRPLHEVLVGNVARTLWIVLGAVGVLLLIACANVANLFLARGEGRQHELGVRRALGAGRASLLGEFLTEAIMLCGAGGALGLLGGALGVRLLQGLPMAAGIPRLSEVRVDGTVVGFTLMAAALAAAFVSAIPVLRTDAFPLAAVLSSGGRSSTAGRVRQRTRRGLVVAQVALALTLLAGAGLLVQSFLRLRAVDPGFGADGALTFRLALPSASYATAGETARAVVETMEALSAIPGVAAAGLTTRLPLDQEARQDSAVFMEDRPPAPGTIPPIHSMAFATPGYFRAMEIPLLAGRLFGEPDLSADPAASPHEVVVSQAFAERHWNTTDAIGKRIRMDPRVPWSTIVGVVGNLRDDGLEQPPGQVVYGALVTEGLNRTARAPRDVALVVRTQGDAAALAASVRGAVESLAPGLPLYRLRTLEDLLAEATSRTRFTLLLLGLAAVAATAVGAVGIYGVIAYLVTLRARELGVRLALGAEPADLRRLIVRHALTDAAIGIAVGLAGAVLLTRALATVAFGVSTADPVALGGAAALLLITAMAASWAPARRAAGVDPASVLHGD